MDLYLVAGVLLHQRYPASVVVDHVGEVVESCSAGAMYGAVLSSLPGEHLGEFRRQIIL